MVENKTREVDNFIKKLLGFSMSSYIGFFITFFSTFIGTRLFSAGELGKVNMFLSCFSLGISVCYLGLDQAYCRFYHEENFLKRKTTLSICLTLALVWSLIVFLVGLFFQNSISYLILGELNFHCFYFLSTIIFCQVFLRFFNLSQRMNQNIIGFTVLAVLISIANKMSYTLAALSDRQALTGFFFMASFFVIITIISYFKKFKRCISFKYIFSAYKYKYQIKQLLFFSIPLVPISFLSLANGYIPQLFMRSYLDFDTIGIYGTAVTLCSSVSLIQSGFNAFWMPYVYANYKYRNNTIKKVHNTITMILLLFIIFIFIFENIIYDILIGDEFYQSILIFPLLLVSPISYTIAETTGVGINISKKSYLNFYHVALGFFSNCILCIILVPKFGMIGAALSVSISAIVQLCVKTYIGEKYYKCTSNLFVTFFSIFLFMFIGIINLFVFNKFILKIIIACLLMLLIYIMYRSEIKFITSFLIYRINERKLSK